jgi:hypothetical protein
VGAVVVAGSDGSGSENCSLIFLTLSAEASVGCWIIIAAALACGGMGATSRNCECITKKIGRFCAGCGRQTRWQYHKS